MYEKTSNALAGQKKTISGTRSKTTAFLLHLKINADGTRSKTIAFLLRLKGNAGMAFPNLDVLVTEKVKRVNKKHT